MPIHEKYSPPYVVIFIPAHNEEGSIGRVLDDINKHYRGAVRRDFVLDIIVVDDGSVDKTAEIAKRFGVSRIVSHPTNCGLGAATRSGMQAAYEIGADIAVKIDADFQHDPEDIEKVIRPILDDRADCVFGSRFLGGLQYKMPLHRALGNRFFSWLTSKLTGLVVTDGQTGLMAFNRRYLSRFAILHNYNETQQLIIDSWGKGMRVIEISVLFHKRVTGKSFISWRYPSKVLPAVARTYIHAKPLRAFFGMGVVIFLAGFLIGIFSFFHIYEFFGPITATILIMVGVQIILFGFLADIISKKR